MGCSSVAKRDGLHHSGMTDDGGTTASRTSIHMPLKTKRSYRSLGYRQRYRTLDGRTWGMRALNRAQFVRLFTQSADSREIAEKSGLGDFSQLLRQAAQGFPRVLGPLRVTQAFDDAVNGAGGSHQTCEGGRFRARQDAFGPQTRCSRNTMGRGLPASSACLARCKPRMSSAKAQ